MCDSALFILSEEGVEAQEEKSNIQQIDNRKRVMILLSEYKLDLTA